MNVMITGIAGLLGSRLATWIIDNTEHNIIGVDDLSGGYIENIDTRQDRCKFYKLNTTSDVSELGEIFKKEKIDIVYHLAAYAAEGLSPFIRRFNYLNNVIGSISLINYSIKYSVKRFIFTSSMAVYGDKYAPPFNESMQPFPIDPYGIAKFSIEQDLECAYRQHGLKYTVIRPHNVYGLGQNIWDKYRNVLGIWMYQILNNQRPTIYGDGNQKRAFSYIDDCLLPLWTASQSDDCIGEIINLGGIKETSINDACKTLIKVIGTDMKPLYLEERHEAKYAWSTWDKSVELLNFEHKTELDEGLNQMWAWAKEQPNRKRKTWDVYELENGLYEYWKNK